MGLLLPDDILRQAGVSEKEALAELACRLYDSDKLDFFTAARLAGLDRTGFERELRERKLPIIHYTEEDYKLDLEGIAHLEKVRLAEIEGRK